jgi:fatty acid desaturase 2 (delta-6 desaturase)
MGKGSKSIRMITWDEVSKHDKKDDRWLVINDQVFDVTEWSKRHPGGIRMISHFAGQDATVSAPKYYLSSVCSKLFLFAWYV